MPKTKQEIATVTPIAAAPSPLSLKLGDALFSVLSVSADWSGDYRAQFELYGLNVKAINSPSALPSGTLARGGSSLS